MLEIDDHCVMDAARTALANSDNLSFDELIDLTADIQDILYLYLVGEQDSASAVRSLQELG